MENSAESIPPVLWVTAPPGSSKDQLAEKLSDEISNRKTQPLTEATINNYLPPSTKLEEQNMLNRVKSLTLTAKILQQNNIIPVLSCWLTHKSQLDFLKEEIKNLHFLAIEIPPEKCLESVTDDRQRKLLKATMEADFSAPDPTEFGQGIRLSDQPVSKLLNSTLEYLNEENIITDSSEPGSEEVVDRLKNIGYI